MATLKFGVNAIRMHLGNMALHIDSLGEHFATIRALELLYLYLSCTMLLGSVFLQIDFTSDGESTYVTHKVLGLHWDCDYLCQYYLHP